VNKKVKITIFGKEREQSTIFFFCLPETYWSGMRKDLSANQRVVFLPTDQSESSIPTILLANQRAVFFLKTEQSQVFLTPDKGTFEH